MKPRKPLKRSTKPLWRSPVKRIGKVGKRKLEFMKTAKANFFALGHGQCQLCGEHFAFDSVIDAHHKVKRSLGGSDAMTNLVILHRGCHFTAHSNADIFKRIKESTADAINGERIL